MFIDVELTPNPNARKFVLNKKIIESGSKQYNSKEEAKDDQLAEKLFSLNGVVSVFYLSDFITVTKDTDDSWRTSEEDIKKIITESIDNQINTASNSVTTTLDSKLKQIDDILEETVRPGLAMDGGGLEVVSLSDDMQLSVKYHGACGSCPSSTYGTLQAITYILKENFHPDIEVVAV
ncbi:MAG: NifU family protein [Candidatus Sericytochromatia bacterium]|nr:NifU family protein [Candidatus Sericytochromatia bacterium]